jgi:riboflavin synthase
VIDAGAWEHRPSPGDSISVSGCCLTVARIDPRGLLGFDAVPETLSLTTLGGYQPGRRVNLEHAVTAQTLMGGHIVQGHVDGVGVVRAAARAPEWRIRIAPPAELMEFLSPKGSVTVDGVSLTIAALARTEFEVALIPTTLEKTTLGDLNEGSTCNLEMDIVAKTIVHHMKNFGSR